MNTWVEENLEWKKKEEKKTAKRKRLQGRNASSLVYGRENVFVDSFFLSLSDERNFHRRRVLINS